MNKKKRLIMINKELYGGGIPGTSYLDSLTFFILGGGYSGNMKFEVPDIFHFGGVFR